MKFLPKMYKKNIFEIDYKKLKKMGIKCLMFDLDNTICIKKETKIKEELVELFKKLKKDFIIYIVSNNASRKKVKKYSDKFNVNYYHFSMKPLTHNFYKIKKINNLKKEEICMIGDQLLTDIYAANKFGCFSVLVDRLANKDMVITSFNRKIEDLIFKKYKKYINKGDYYG